MDINCKYHSNGEHSLIVTRWDKRMSPAKESGYDIATTFICEKCFRLFDAQEIHDRHYEMKDMEREASESSGN